MPKSRKEVLEKLDELFGIIDKSKKDPKNVKLNLDAEFAKKMIHDIISNSIANVVNSFKSVEEISEHFDFFKLNKEEVNNKILRLYRNIPSSLNNEKSDEMNQKIDEVFEKKDLSFDDKIKEIQNILVEDPDRLANIQNSINGTLGQAISLNFKVDTLNDAKDVYNSLADRFGEIAAQVDDIEFVSLFERAKNKEIHTRINEINALKEENKDNAEVVKLLDQVDEICQRADLKLTSEINPVFEEVGRYANEIGKLEAKAFFDKNGTGDIVEVTRQQINIKNEYEATNKPKGLAPVIENPIKFTDKAKANLLDITKLLNEAPKDLDSSFGNLSKTRKEIEKAIDDKNIEKIQELVEKYNSYDNIYDTMAKKLEGLSENYMFPMNMSAGRVDTTPFKYRNEPYTASYIRGIIMSHKLFTENGIKFEEFVENPVNATLKLASKISKSNPLTSYLKENDIKTICKGLFGIEDSTRGQLDKKSGDITTTVGCGLSTLSNLASDIGEGFASFYMTSSCICTDIPIYTTLFFATDLNEKIQGILTCEPIDREPKTFGEFTGINPETLQKYEKTNFDEYLRSNKTSLEGVLNRLIDAKESLPNVGSRYRKAFKSAITSTLNLAKDAKANEFNKFTRKVANLIETNKLDKLSNTDRMCLKAIATTKLEVQNKETFINENVNKNINTLSAMKKDYDSRWFFQKWWGSETKNLDASIKLMESSIKEVVGEEVFNSKLQLASKGELNNVMEVAEPEVENNINRIPAEIQIEEKEVEFENIQVEEEQLENMLNKDVEKQP